MPERILLLDVGALPLYGVPSDRVQRIHPPREVSSDEPSDVIDLRALAGVESGTAPILVDFVPRGRHSISALVTAIVGITDVEAREILPLAGYVFHVRTRPLRGAVFQEGRTVLLFEPEELKAAMEEAAS